MAITTDNGKLAVMELEDVWEPGLPALTVPGIFAQGDLQQLLWGFPEILWAAAATAFILDLNTRLYVFLLRHYGLSTGDLTTLTTRYTNGLTGDATARFNQLIRDASA